jgi:chromosomal replication initiation ATPase DnaA
VGRTKFSQREIDIIAKLLGRKNHSTCISSFNHVEDQLKSDSKYAAEVNSLRKEIEKK